MILLFAEMRFGESDPILIIIEASREMLEVGSVETATPLQLISFASGVYLIHRYREISLKIHYHFRQTLFQSIEIGFYFLQELVPDIAVRSDETPSSAVHSMSLSGVTGALNFTKENA